MYSLAAKARVMSRLESCTIVTKFIYNSSCKRQGCDMNQQDNLNFLAVANSTPSERAYERAYERACMYACTRDNPTVFHCLEKAATSYIYIFLKYFEVHDW